MSKRILVWDLPLRLFHWLLVVSFVGCFVFAKLGSDYIDWHLKCGYVVLTLISFRLCWGLFGTKHSKFSGLKLNPKDIKHYVLNFFKPKSESTTTKGDAGHNPLGSLMVIFLWLTILLQAVSGLFMDDDIFTTGPYNGSLGSAFDSAMSFVHHNLINFILAAIALHVFAALYYLHVKRQNLIKPMVTGYKRSSDIDEKEGIAHSKLVVALLVAAVCIMFVYWLVVLNAPVIETWY